MLSVSPIILEQIWGEQSNAAVHLFPIWLHFVPILTSDTILQFLSCSSTNVMPLWWKMWNCKTRTPWTWEQFSNSVRKAYQRLLNFSYAEHFRDRNFLWQHVDACRMWQFLLAKRLTAETYVPHPFFFYTCNVSGDLPKARSEEKGKRIITSFGPTAKSKKSLLLHRQAGTFAPFSRPPDNKK